MSLNEIETRIAKIIENIILTSVEPDTLLLESGLVDSLSAVDVALAIEKEFGVKIPPSEIDLHLESVHALAQYVAGQRKA
ncbi:acyl carrier protein [Delftia tsuruhatensis]|uniref:acyl carrier protein n=1 Tax=Delftia tsuruhatensis TaxID=180282 RepID=UPI001E7BAF0E|nr:acyl carrier protein [Delftia tsuruhatensis]CAB5711549.1 acyl carrier protein [Delftia tsuruhatensis]CAC9686838.1 acyl carrier protein [Delftia tsuruhatensis]